MKRTILILAITIIIQGNVFSQINPSVYLGYGLGTNIGGIVGVGTEVKYKMISLNAAVGSWVDEFPEHTGAKSRFDYDFGIKAYSNIGVFIGVNYGLIGAALYTKAGQQELHFEKTRGFSFTLGFRHTIYKNLYGLGYMGLTSNKDENHISIFGENKGFLPRVGLILGFELFPNKN